MTSAKVLENVRVFAGDGLFTSWTTEPNWRKAQNILLPTFSQQAMKGYHDMMVDIASQLVQKRARLNPNETIDVADDMTRLTLDTIGICGFNYRFNSFYKEKHSPFIESMVRALNEAMHRGRLYVCGDGTHMAPDVEATMLRIYQRVRGADPAEAQAWLEQLQAEGRSAKDVWSRT